MPILNAGYRYTIDQLKRILRTDPVLPIAHLEYRRDLT